MEGFRILDTYKAYKLREQKFITWLKETAAKVGYQPAQPSSRFCDEPSSPLIPIWEMPNIAKAIASTSTVTVPDTLKQLLRDVISQRKEVSVFYRARSQSSQADSGHLHYIQVLQGVLKTFERVKVPACTKLADAATSATALQDNTELTNLFTLLPDEQPPVYDSDGDTPSAATAQSQDSSKENVAPNRRPQQKKKNGKKGKQLTAAKNPAKNPAPQTGELGWYKFTDNDVLEEEEIDFMVYCFFKDFNKVREYLQERWCDYKDGLLSLSAVSVVTNLAFENFRKAEREFFGDRLIRRYYSDYRDLAQLMFFHGLLTYMRREEGVDQPEEGKELYLEEWDWIGYSTYTTIESYLENCKPGKVPIGIPGRDDPIDWRTTDDKEVFRRNQKILLDLLAECSLLKPMSEDGYAYPGEDELTRGIIQMLRDRYIPVWIVFSAHVYIDIRFILEDDVSYSHTELLHLGKHIKDNICSHLLFTDSWNIADDPFIDETAAAVQDWVIDDPAGYSRRNMKRRLGIPDSESDAFYYLRHNPIAAGLMVFSFSLTYNELGLRVSNIFGATIGKIHLYNAVRTEIPDFSPWLDMDVLRLIHHNDNIFPKGVPRKPRQMPSQLSLEQRGLQTCSVISDIFHDKFCFAHRLPWIRTLPRVELVLNQLAQDSMQTTLQGLGELSEPGTGSTSHMHHDADSRALADRMVESNRVTASLTRQFQVSRVLTPVQLLDALCRRISQEATTLNFNYISMHLRSLRLLRALNEEFKADILAMGQAKVEEGQNELPCIPMLIFKLMEKEDRSALGGKSVIAERVAKIMEKFVEQEGDAELMAVKKYLSSAKDRDGRKLLWEGILAKGPEVD